MAIQPVAQPPQPQINHKVEKKRDYLKTMKTAKRAFAALAVCFAAAAVISLSIGMAAPLAIITGTAALVSIVAFTILYCKNKSTIRALADTFYNYASLSDEEQSQVAKMLMNSSWCSDHRALAKNLEKFPALSDAKKLKFAGRLIKSWNWQSHSTLADNLKKFIPASEDKKLKLAEMLINSKKSFDHRVFADNLELFIPLDDAKKLKLAEMLMNSNWRSVSQALADNLGLFIPASEDKKLVFAKMLMNSGYSKESRALAKNLEKFPALSDAKKLKLGEILIEVGGDINHETLAKNLDKFPTLPLENIKTLITEMLKSDYNFITLISNFNSVVKQLSALLNNSADEEKGQIVIELKAIQDLMKNAMKDTNKLKRRIGWWFTNYDFINVINRYLKSIKDLDKIILSQVKNKYLETKKPIDESSKTLDGLLDGLKDMCEFGGE